MLKPIKLKVIIDPIQKPTETESGIFVGNTNLDGSMLKGTIVGVGDQVKDLKIGDKVIYQNFSGQHLEFEGKKYTTMYETEVIAIYEED